MSSEHRLDRLEKIVRLVVKEGLRERREMRDKINALISAQMRHEDAYAQSRQRTYEAMAELARAQANTQEALAHFQMRTEETLVQFGRRTDEEMARLARAQADTDEGLNSFIKNTDERLNAFITNTDEKLNAFIGAVERLVNERRKENP